MSHQDAQVRHDESRQRYVLEINGQPLGFAQYQEEGDRQVFTHTEIDDSLAGQGMGSMLARAALDDARRRGKRIVPVCAFIAAYVNKHPDWSDVLDQPA
ncbi:GNAT family N-acetyltransferase [Stutzerimonas stutzeri]|uniref:GNAT family N-acetyltransferase n=1 Tax=Stutzerimonas stutzeri TaxID=316 RepID=UPI0015E45097|nr:GNAT family N-acetyltransferase [Stutzerimonas stutzeri]MBA1264641.1 N-acetyltransferase [Stutzerimonas stutzeri]